MGLEEVMVGPDAGDIRPLCGRYRGGLHIVHGQPSVVVTYVLVKQIRTRLVRTANVHAVNADLEFSRRRINVHDISGLPAHQSNADRGIA